MFRATKITYNDIIAAQNIIQIPTIMNKCRGIYPEERQVGTKGHQDES